MRLRHLRYPLGHIHARIDDQLCQVLRCLSVLPGIHSLKIPGESSSKAIHDPTVPTIQTLISYGRSYVDTGSARSPKVETEKLTPGKATQDLTLPTRIGRCTM